MMRRVGVLCVGVLLAACTSSGGDDGESPTTPSSAATSSADAVTTSSAGATSTTGTTVTVPLTTDVVNTTMGTTELMPDQPVLIVNGDGVFEITTAGAIRKLVTGPVAYAVDDTRGGLLFQIERGRQVFAGFEGEQPSGRSTIIWWIPAGAAAPQELLVPTPGEGQYLSLHDTFATDESFAVVYERHEGTVPFDSDDGRAADMADRLRVFDVGSGSVTELYRVRGYEWNLADITAGAGLVSATEAQTGGGGCRLFDAATGELVTPPGFPSATPACFDDFTPCAGSCALSPDASQVAYDWVSGGTGDVEWEIHVADLATGDEATSLLVPVTGESAPAELDVDDGLVLLNRHREGAYDDPPLLVDIHNPSRAPVELPITGRARFVTESVDIGPTAAVVWYRARGTDEGGALVSFGPELARFALLEGTEPGRNKTLSTSPDGLLWDRSQLPGVLADLRISGFANAEFGYALVADFNPDELWIGSDGSWTKADLPVDQNWVDVGLWDIVELTVGPEGILVKGIGGSSNASNTTVVLWSGDGRQFTMVLENGNPPGAAIGDLAIAGDHERYVAIAQQCVGCWPPTDDWSIAHEVLVSNDGPAWLSVTTSPFADLPNGEQLEVLSLETRNGVALAATRDRSGASQLLRSSDLVHWSDVTPWSASDKSDSAWSTVTAGPAGWLARMQQDQATWAWLSTDAHNWHLIQPPADVGAFDTLPAEQWAIGTDRVVYLPITGPAASAWIWVAALVGF